MPLHVPVTYHYCVYCNVRGHLDQAWMCESCHLSFYTSKQAQYQKAVLDVFCGIGGAARGYVQAGYEVWGADLNPRLEKDYLKSGACKFYTANALDMLADRKFVRRFDFIHASPPCQRYSQMTRCRPGLAEKYPDLIGPVRELLLSAGVPFLIENVEGAKDWMLEPMTLCGTMFQRPVYRHRLFDPGHGIVLHAPKPQEIAKFNRRCGWHHPVRTAKAGHWEPGKYVSVSGHERKEPVRQAMDIDWASRREDIAEAIPPYFTRWVGEQVLPQLR